MPRNVFVDETEWWDRVAAAADLLIKRLGGRRADTVAAGARVAVFTDRSALAGSRSSGAPGEADVTAYLFDDVRDAEILRRLTQMPDETPLDMLRQPVSVYCPEMKSFVSVNNPQMSLEEHMEKLLGEKGENA